MQTADLEMEQGATFRVSLTYEDSDEQPISLTGYKAHMQVRRRVGSPVLIDLSTENGGITLEPGSVVGVIDIKAGASQTSAVTKNSVYDLHLILESDTEEVIRIFGGAITVIKAVTIDE